MPKYIVNGKTYNIPEDKVEGFERKYPDANVEYSNEGKTYHIPINKREGFLKQYPNAIAGTFDQTAQPTQPPTPTATQPQPDNEEYIEGFGKGVKQGTEQLAAGIKYAGAEGLDFVSHTAKDNADALTALEQMQAEGKDVTKETEADAKSVLLPLLGHSGSTIDMVARLFGKKNPIAKASAEADTDRTIRRTLKETDGDVEAAKALLEQRASEQTTADRWREEAAQTMNEAKPTKGFGAWVGNFVPQMAGTLTGLGLSAVTKSPVPAQILGMGQMGALTAATAGASMKEARDAGATTGEAWAAGMADAVVEFATEAIPFKKLTKAISANAKAKIGKGIAEAIADKDSPAGKELQDLLTRANKELGGKLFSTKTAGEYIEQMATEGLSEFAAEALQTITPILYQEPENYPTLKEIFNNGMEGLKGGIFMGSILGGASQAATHRAQRDRRKTQGYVDVAEVKLNDKGETSIVEVVDYNPKDNTATVLHDGELITIDNATDNIIEDHRFTFEEFDRGQIEVEQEESYNTGSSLETPQEKNDAKNNLEYNAQEIRRIFGLPDDTDVDEMLGDDPLTFARQQRDNDPEVGQTILDYINAKAVYDGMIDNVNDRIENTIAQSDKMIDSRVSKTDGMIHPATLKLNDRKVYIIDGKVSTLEDNSIDTANSDESIIIMDAETGNVEFSEPSALFTIGTALDPEQEKAAAGEVIANTIADEAEREIDGVLPFNVGDTYTILDDQGVQHTVQIAADNGDNTIQMVMDGETEATTATKDMVQQMAEAYNLNRLAIAQTEKKAAEAQQNTADNKVEQPIEEAQPAPRIPMDESGNPVYESAPVYDTWAELLEMNEGNEEEAIDTANIMRENAQAELDKAMKAPKVAGKTVPEIQAAKAQQKVLIKQAQDKLNYWTDVANYRDAQIELMKRAEQRANMSKAQAASQEKGRYSEENAALGAPIDFRDHVMRAIATGGVRFIWSDAKSGTRGLGSHTGLSASNEERNKRIWMLSNDNGLYPEEAAEQLLTSYTEELGYAPNIDTMDALSEILDVVGSYATPSSMFEAAKSRHEEVMAEATEQEADDAYYSYKRAEAEANGMTLDEWLDYEDMMMTEFAPDFESNYDGIIATFVEAAQEAEILNNNNNESSRDNEDVQQGVHQESGLPDGSQAGVGILQGTQVDNGIADSRGAEAGQGGDVQTVESGSNDIPSPEVSGGAEESQVSGNDDGGSRGGSNQRKYRVLSKEVDENGYLFVVSKNGTTSFGKIREESGLPEAPIKLSEGYQDENKKGYGLAHIEANHGDQIRKEGFASVEDFVSFVAENYDEDNIRVGKRRRDNNTTYLIQVTDAHDNTLYIELSKDGSYWNVNSGGIFRKGYANKKETVAKTEPQQPNNAISSGSSHPVESIDGISTTEPNGEPTVSESKDTTTEQQKQEVEQKKVQSAFKFSPKDLVATTKELAIEPTKPTYTTIVAPTLVKGAKWDSTGEPTKMKFKRKGDNYDGYITVGKKNYGRTTSEGEELDILLEDYGTLENAWNAYEQGEVFISPNLATIVKAILVEKESNINKPKKTTKANADKQEEIRFRGGELTEEERIIAQAEADGTYLKAPNGKDTNLTPKQWVQVRTKAFKNWFGDWEKAAIANYLMSDEVAATLSGNEFVKDETPLTDKVTRFYADNYDGKVTRKGLGEVLLDKRSVKDSASHGLGKAKSAAFAAVPNIITNGRIIDTQSNWKGRGYDSVTIAAPIRIGDDVYVGVVVVKKSKEFNRFYLHEVMIQKSLRDGVFQTSLNAGNPSGDIAKVIKNIINANNSSKIVDANGEPKVVYHRTPNEFTTFDVEKIGSSTDAGAFGRGFYFSPLDQYGLYGKNNMALFLNAKNPLVLDNANAFDIKEPFFGEDYSWNKESSEKFSKWAKDNGHDAVIYKTDLEEEDVVFEPNQIKSATDNVGTFNSESNDIRFRTAPVFYSNAEYAVKAVKQEKATPEQWRKMIEKNGGLKAGEDKWLELSDWLKASDKKTLTKQEVLDFIKENQIQIEEVVYGQVEWVGENEIYESEEFTDLLNSLTEYEEDNGKEYPYINKSKFQELRNSDEDFVDGFDIDYWGESIVIKDPRAAARYLGLTNGGVKNINGTRIQYTTDGLDNKREIALTVPTIESWNESDEIHFGDAGNGRAIAWVRFGETTDADGNRVLVIDEVQSKRHQEGREKGYAKTEANDAFEVFREQMMEKYGIEDIGNIYKVLNAEDKNEFDRLRNAANNEFRNSSDIPSAPFEKNWAELAMKRMLRYAAENGFDKIAWTTGEQQADRYDLSKSVDVINAERNEDGSYNINVATVDDSHFIQEINIPESRLAELVGKDIALSIAKATQDSEDGKAEIEGDNLRIGGSGMKAFYDQMIPSFMNKYGKKWGVKVGEVTMPNLEENNTMHSIDVTDAMRESVMQGQPMFRVANFDQQFADLQAEYDALDKNDAEALNTWREKKTNVVRNYLSHIKNRFGMRGELIVFNGANEKQIQQAYQQLIASYEVNGNTNPPTYEAFKEKSLRKNVVGTYRKGGNTITFNATADDAQNRKMQFAETMFHENAHRVSDNLYSDKEFESIWAGAKKSKDRIAKMVNELYEDRNDVTKGKEYIAKSVGYLANEQKDSFMQFLRGKMPVEELLKKLRSKSEIAKLAVEETLNIIKDEYRVQLSRRGDTREMGGVGYGSDLQDSRMVLQGDERAKQGRRADNAERGLRGRVLKAATDLAESLGVKMTVIEDVNNITGLNTRLQRAKRGAKAWYNTATDEVVFVAPNATSVEDAVQTVLHEVVAHKGLRDVVGRDHFEEFLDKVFQAADPETRSKIIALATENGWDFRVATEEYLASLAEQGFDSRENRTFLQKVRDLFMDMLRAAKIVLGFNINDNDMRYMLWRTYQMQRSKGTMSVAEDVIMQQKLGVGNFRNRSMTEAEQIIADAKANGTYLKAPNGKKSNLTPKQWVQVRTKAFKNWFGDWEKTARIEKLRKSKDAKIAGNEIEASEDLKQYKKNAQMYGRTLQGEYTNTDTGVVISLQRGRHNGGINEVLQHNYKDVAHLQSVAAIPQIIENGIYIESQPNTDTNTNPNVTEYQLFVCGLKIGGEDYTVLAKVAVDNKGNRYYDHNLVSVEKGKLIDIANNEQSAISSGFGSTPDTKSTTNSQRKYKELISLLQTNSSKIVDANGEPKVVYNGSKVQHYNYDGRLRTKGQSATNSKVSFFTDNKDVAERYGKFVNEVFLNIRNPYEIDYNGAGWQGWSGAADGMQRASTDSYADLLANGAVDSTLERIIENYGRAEADHLASGKVRNENIAPDGVIAYEVADPMRSTLYIVRNAEAKNISRNSVTPKGVETFTNLGKSSLLFDSQIKSATDNVGTFNPSDDDIRYRVAPTTPSTGEARKEYDDAVRSYTKKNNVKKRENLMHRLKEAYQDSMLSLKKLQEAVLKETGNKLRDFEDAYTAENHLSSKNKAEIEAWERDYMKPLWKELFSLMKKGASYSDIVDYLLAKHGLERNLEFSRKEAEEKGETWDGFVKRDYSGLTELTGEAEVFTEAAQQIVDEFESKYNTDNLWSKINAATKESLRKSYDSGLMSKETYDKVSTMFKYYVPLRGWANDVAADQYEYISDKGMKIMPVLKTAKGRVSRAEDPIATLGSVGESSIIQGNRNLMKQKFLNFAQNNPTSLLTVSEQWYVKQADGTWRPDSPIIPEGATGDEVDAILKQHEADMEALGANATKKRQGLNIDLHTTRWEQEEHAVNVKRNGKEYKIFVNGNPIAAMAINGLTNPNASEDSLIKGTQHLKNFMARVFTSQNPAFIITNLTRDLIWAGSSVAIKEDAAYTRRYTGNMMQAFKKVQLPRLIKKWKDGTLDMDIPIERYFKEFVENGAETGFTQLNTVDDYKRDLERFLKEAQGGAISKGKKAWRGFWDGVEFLNRSAEDTTRFMVYLTSRQMGRSITESVANAKDVTVNFNRKGRGNLGAKYMNQFYIFFNATIQSLANFGKLISENPKKTTAALTTFTAAGILAPMVSLALQSLLSDDDDEPTYWDLPEWTRRNNIVIHLYNGTFLTIPLPHELRPFYGMGELALSAMMGKETPGDAAEKAAAGFASLLPFDYTGNGGNPIVNFTPTVAQPLAQLVINKNYFGTPIYRDTPYNKLDPEWTKAYKSSNQVLVDATELLNEITGGDAVKSGVIDINPAIVEHLFESYLGGLGKTLNRTAKTFSMLWDEDVREWRNAPVASSFIQQADERTSGSQVNREYFAATDEAEDVEHLYSGYRKRAAMGSMEYAELLNELINSDVFKRYQIINSYQNAVNKLNTALKGVDTTDREEIETAIMELKVEMLEELEKLEESNNK